MHQRAFRRLSLVIGLTMPLTGAALAQQPRSPTDDAFARATAFQATVFGYPLTGMYARLTEEVLDASTRKAPLNVYFHYRALATPEVSPFPAPNNDTLYSTAWLDLRKEPAILTMPDTAGRYYTAHLLDMATETLTNFGQRLDGTGAQHFAVVGPDWNGQLPPGIKRVVRSETRFAYVLLRLLVDGPQDVPAVNALQDRFAIASLSRFSAGKTGVDEGEPIVPYKAETPEQRFAMLDRVLRLNPVVERDKGVVASFGALGIGPIGASLRVSPSAEILGDAEKDARAFISSVGPRTGVFVNGWRKPAGAIGAYGTDYLQRASVWDGGPLANTQDESFYPAALLDADNRPLNGTSGRYTIRFSPGQRPPVQAFWSITMYKMDDKNLVANPIQRYSVGNRTKGLVEDADGGLTVSVQAEKPDDPKQAANWLPAPKEPFYMVLRLYGPKPEAISGAWSPPAVVPAKR